MVVIHKMIERLGLEGGFEDHLVPTPKVSSVSTSGLFLYKMQPIVCGVLSSSRSSSKYHRVRAHHSLHWNKPSSLFSSMKSSPGKSSSGISQHWAVLRSSGAWCHELQALQSQPRCWLGWFWAWRLCLLPGIFSRIQERMRGKVPAPA